MWRVYEGGRRGVKDLLLDIAADWYDRSRGYRRYRSWCDIMIEVAGMGGELVDR